ncbi:MAG TPA: hypothetical protein VGC95_03605 [Chitinophagaceae bacterium]
MILLAGMVIGLLKGQDARNKWVSRQKMKYEARKAFQKKPDTGNSLVMLDDIEMSTYHS